MSPSTAKAEMAPRHRKSSQSKPGTGTGTTTVTLEVEESSSSEDATAHRTTHKRQKKRSSWLIFTIGGLAGLLLAGAAAKNQDIGLQLLRDMSLDSIIDVIPVGILKEASDISQREKAAVNYEAFSTGLSLKAQGLEVKYPVVMVCGLG